MRGTLHASDRRGLLRAAKHNVEHRFAVVGVVERMWDSFTLLRAAMGLVDSDEAVGCTGLRV